VGDTKTQTPVDDLVDLDSALHRLQDIERKHGRPVVGLFAVPLDHPLAARVEAKELFDACTNVSIGTAIISEIAESCVESPAKKRGKTRKEPAKRASDRKRVCISRQYGRLLGMPGLDSEVMRVLYEKENTGVHGDEKAQPLLIGAASTISARRLISPLRQYGLRPSQEEKTANPTAVQAKVESP